MAVEAETASTPGRRWPRSVLLVGIGCAVLAAALVAALVLLATRSGPGSPPRAAAVPATPKPSGSTSPSVAQIYAKVGPSVVVIQTAHGALGTGVVAADNGTILTANHVISDGSAIRLIFADGTKASAKVLASDPKTDVAELAPSALPQPLVPATIGGSAGVGSRVVAIGNPVGLTYSVSSGEISGLNRTARTDVGTFSGLIQFDASVNPGSSGGPLLDANGDVIGIVDAIENPAHADAFAGIAFAVPIGTALGTGGGKTPQL